ncbi:hypothetical protein [Brevundimonas sp.]|uniref:hypothetical protein n=1 Tax=Brevundimonas sp. TaxID=1871086 RepID=UPI003A94E456
MADIPALTQFSLSENEDGYLLQLEAADGQAMTVSATPEQLDAIIDALVALLEDDEEDADTPLPIT